MSKAILIDCDVVFRSDVKRLFDEFEKFVFEMKNIVGHKFFQTFNFYNFADSLPKICSDWRRN